MEIVDASQESSTGLELDKIDLSDILHAPVTEKKAQKEGKKKGRKSVFFNINGCHLVNSGWRRPNFKLVHKGPYIYNS